MSIKKFIALAIALILIVDVIVFLSVGMSPHAHIGSNNYESAQVKAVDSTIVANGSITAQDEADLHFQTAGKLVSVPFKEGASVAEGQTIAQLDTYTLQQELSEALNNYVSTRDQSDQSQINQNNNVTQNTQRGQDNFNGAGLAGGSDPATTNYLNDVA